MSTFGNIAWMILGGLIVALGYFIGGLLLCLTVIGIPFGVQAIRYAGALLAPFGKDVKKTDSGFLGTIFNAVWLIAVGWEIAVVHIVFGILLALTGFGLPFAQQHFKLIPVALLPFQYNLEK